MAEITTEIHRLTSFFVPSLIIFLPDPPYEFGGAIMAEPSKLEIAPQAGGRACNLSAEPREWSGEALKHQAETKIQSPLKPDKTDHLLLNDYAQKAKGLSLRDWPLRLRDSQGR